MLQVMPVEIVCVGVCRGSAERGGEVGEVGLLFCLRGLVRGWGLVGAPGVYVRESRKLPGEVVAYTVCKREDF